MRPAQLGELINAPSLGKVVKKMINQIPRLQLEASIQPLTRGLLRMDLILTPDFQWDQEQHGYVEPFLILVRSSTAGLLLVPAQTALATMPASAAGLRLGKRSSHMSLPPCYCALRLIAARSVAFAEHFSTF
jgi:hypothetical protein